MPKVVINSCYGGFSLSQIAKHHLIDKGLSESVIDEIECNAQHRHHPALIEVIEALGGQANGTCANLTIVTVNDLYIIDDYDGLESIRTPESIHWIDSNHIELCNAA